MVGTREQSFGFVPPLEPLGKKSFYLFNYVWRAQKPQHVRLHKPDPSA